LVEIDKSPVVLLNRAVALSKAEGAGMAIEELQKLQNILSLKSYHLLYAVLAESYIELDKFGQAAEQLQKAIDLTPLDTERIFLQKKLKYCYEKIF
jgi:RNA polymerase sigma-70 factor (ECF subfamily)